MSVYFCQPGKASNLLAPQPRLVLRRSRCRLQVGKISDTSGFQRRDLKLRFRDSQEMSGTYIFGRNAQVVYELQVQEKVERVRQEKGAHEHEHVDGMKNSSLEPRCVCAM